MQLKSFRETFGKDKKGSKNGADPETACLNEGNKVSITIKKPSIYNIKLRDLEASKKYTIRVNTIINGRTIASRSEGIEAIYGDS